MSRAHPVPTLTEKQVEDQRRCLELRRAGLTYDVIAEQVGLSNKSLAYKYVQSALKRTLQEPADDLRNLEVDRLDRLQTALWANAMRGDNHSVDRILRIAERRARLLGLDRAPLPDVSGIDNAGSLIGTLMTSLRVAYDEGEKAAKLNELL